MYRLTGLLIAITLTPFASLISADSIVRVNAMNYPAWLVRNYQTLPLQPGTRLQNDDLIRTGKGGRVQLQLSAAGAIRLGESSRFIIRQSSVSSSDSGTPIQQSFQALRGVFRINATNFNDVDPEHRLVLDIGAIKTLVGNADIWGRADLSQDAVCLVEGELRVEASGTDRVNMNQALSCYVKPRNQAPLPVDLIDIRQHQLWLAETDLREESGIVAEDGQWQLVLISLTNALRAEQTLNGFQQQGFAVQDKTVERNGRTLHRLLLPGFVSIDAALDARAWIEKQLGVSETWVWKAN